MGPCLHREVRESNARFVRWEDGSLQLMLGNEVLDVPDQDISHNNYYLFVLRGVIQVGGDGGWGGVLLLEGTERGRVNRGDPGDGEVGIQALLAFCAGLPGAVWFHGQKTHGHELTGD